MQRSEFNQQGSLRKKFRCAFRGAKRGVRGESNFFVHFFMAAAVLAAGFVLQVTLTEWCLLLLSIGFVLWAEMFNSALEHMARAVTKQYHEEIRDALDISSASVLIASIGASFVGLIIFLRRLGLLFGWWSGE